MLIRHIVSQKLLPLLLVLLLLGTAQAGTNEGATFSIDSTTPSEVLESGQIDIRIGAQNVISARNTLITVQYDPTVVEFKRFVRGSLISSLISLPEPPSFGDAGLARVRGGGAQLGTSGTAGSGDGLLGTMQFELICSLPVEGTFISITAVEIGLSTSDKDVFTFAPGTLGVDLSASFRNKLANFQVFRDYNKAEISWTSSLPGLEDGIRYRAVGATEWQTAVNPLVERLSLAVESIQGLQLILDQGLIDLSDIEGIDANASLDDLVRDLDIVVLLDNFDVSVPEDVLVELEKLSDLARSGNHRARITGLGSDTQYEYMICSTSIAGLKSARHIARFRTRQEPDTRPLTISNLDIQARPTSATLRWFTNRLADTRYTIVDSTGATLVEALADPDGTETHIAQVEGLEPGHLYQAFLGSRLVLAGDLLDGGFMTEEEVSEGRIQNFRTPSQTRSLRFVGPPFRVVGPERANILVELNQTARLAIDYGPVENFAAKVTAQMQVETERLYTDRVSSSEALKRHNLALSGLIPETEYRFRLTAVGDEIIDTDPRGNEQWSRDLRFTTSAAGDTLSPEIIEGPQVIVRNNTAVVRLATDVETVAQIWWGTNQDDFTFNTPNEFTRVDLTDDGRPRFSQQHFILITGLETATNYAYRIRVTAANGKSHVFNPFAAAKAAKALQPPGGAGSFVTTNVADTQFPVILAGPTTSLTFGTAVVEWITDEPADSQVDFGLGSLEDQENLGDEVISHKIVLTNLTSNESYQYQAGSTDAQGNGATLSSLAAFTTPPEIDLTDPVITEPPAVVYKNERSAAIRWTTDEEATAQVDFGPSAALGFIRTLASTQQAHEITLTNLEPATTYQFKVASSDLSNNGPTESGILSFTTDAAPDLTPPVLSNIVVTPADKTAIITWDTDELADSFVEFGENQGLFDFNTGDPKDVVEHEITLTNLQPGTTYFYVVGSVDRSNNPPTESAVASFTTQAEADLMPPAVPQGLSGVVGSGQVILTWTANTEADLAGYNVYSNALLIASNLTQPTYTDLGLDNGVENTYSVRAVDRNFNESADSEPVALTPVATAGPSTPTDLAREGDDFLLPVFVFANATPVGQGATLTYTIQISTEEDFSNVTTSISGLTEGAGGAGTGLTAWLIDRQLDEGSTYFWRVRAIENQLVGPYSQAQQFVASDQPVLAGDFNGDNSVNFSDFFLFVNAFGSSTGQENYVAAIDLNADGAIDFSDFFAFVNNFGQSVAGKRWIADVDTDTHTRLSLEAVGGTRADGQLITVRVRADQVEQLQGYGLVLAYDPAAVVFDQATPGPGHLLESQGGQAPLFSVLSDLPGELVVGNGLTRGETVSGTGLLAQLQFRLHGPAKDAFFELRQALIARPGQQISQVQHLASARLRPQTFFLGANFPNPFNPSTSIEYGLPQDSPVALTIYDILGRRVRWLVRQDRQAAGLYTVGWDGRDEAGRAVGTGLYFFRLDAGSFSHTQKMTLLK